MKKLIAILFILSSSFVFSQNDYNADSLFRTLPNLQELIDTALLYSPMMKSQDAEIAKKEFELKISKNRWLYYLTFVGDAKYGTFDQLVINQDAVTGTASGLYSNNTANRIQTGLSVKFSIFELLKDKYDKKIALKDLEISHYKREEIETYLRQTIMKQYHEVLLNYKLMNVKLEFYQLAKIGRDFIEIDYKNSLCEYTEVARAGEGYQKAYSEYETAKTNFIISILYLEYVVGKTLLQ